MLWLPASIFAYFILAIAFLMDKYLLITRIPNPKLYAFYAGVSGVLIFAISPFVGFFVPPFPQLILSFLAGATSIFALFYFYQALRLFEASRVIPAIGALVPLFTLGLIYIISGGKETLSVSEIPAFVLLILGSFFITYERALDISLAGLKFSILTAFFFALYFVLTKYVYLNQPFWNGLIWISGGGFLMALCFFFLSRDIREEIFQKQATFQKKTMFIFVLSKIMGGGGGLLQNWAIFLAPLAMVAIINALQGVQYAFLLLLVTFLSLTQPLWAKRAGFKEEISRKILFQKIIAILLIGLGLAFLSLK